MAAVFYFPLIGTPTAEGYQLSFYEAGTDTPLNVWTDSDLTIPWAQPIILNAAGESDGPIYVSSTPSYKVVYTDAEGAAIPGYPVDFVSPSTIINVMTTSITTLTNAQIKALPTTPITLIAAPGAGLRIKVLSWTATAHSVSAYTNINTTFAILTLITQTAEAQLALGLANDSTTVPALTQVTDFFSAPGYNLIVDLPAPDLGAPVTTSKGWVVTETPLNYGVSAMENLALQVTLNNNGSGALTGGNAANTLTIVVYYVLESVV